MVRVAAHPEADELRVDPGAARLRMLVFLDHDAACAVAQHEAVAVAVPGPARLRRRVVALRQRAGRAESGETDRRAAILGTARHHHVGVAVLDHPRGEADAVVPVVQAVTIAKFGPVMP